MRVEVSVRVRCLTSLIAEQAMPMVYWYLPSRGLLRIRNPLRRTTGRSSR